MSKNKKQPIKPLSPENYVKTKVRTLPIDSCFINNDWKEAGIANIFVIRKHTTGKITFGVYLVDLFALGVKNTFFNFNQPEEILNDILNENYIMIDYNTAHNIIYGGVEFAEENGFKTHKDFKKITQYILEPDDEGIPIIAIEFGKGGKPFVIL